MTSRVSESKNQPTRRQYVNYGFFRIDPQFASAPAEERAAAKSELTSIVDRHSDELQLISYSTIGLKAETDFMLWQIGYDLDVIQSLNAEMRRSAMGRWMTMPVTYLAMTKHSQYVREHVHEGQEGRRLRIVPGEAKYLFVYPFLKTRPWFLLPMEERQRMMTAHIELGHKYPRVKINTTYSFGLDDQEWVVAFESDHPEDFLDLVQEMRETEASSYTLRDTPIYTCRRMPLREILDQLG